MVIKKALKTDLNTLYLITKSCAKHLMEQGIFQWNEMYPSKEILLNDIELRQIWKLETKSEIVGLIALTKMENPEYEPVKWLTKNQHNLYIHRLAVHPNFQGKGFAQKLMDFAEKFALENNYDSIRLDTFSKNKRNLKFYEQRNYIKLESVYFPNQSEFPFYCYEKILDV
ncbi:MAG: GNAT family N-acetyltransferase [Bacteroidetes bacterium HGW-Bacteroidetes-3]|jgi:ribosomal protein S18 acetylase RimI-like enzyme|nr:MAG: GNAT family N-acetyltransferase [Bacteroidetes bacterium HGW-Bacteroidetes-3]